MFLLTRSLLLVLAALIPPPARSAPRPLPSLAKINAHLDLAKQHEGRNDYAGALAPYAAVVAECGDPAPAHLWQVAARALVQSGHAHLALGNLDAARTAYQEAVRRYGGVYATDVRPHVLRARTLIARVDEMKALMAPAGPTTEPGVPPGSGEEVSGARERGGPPVRSPGAEGVKPGEPEALVLITERPSGGAGGSTGPRGFEVRPLDGDEGELFRRGMRRASAGGRKVLETGHDMAVARAEVLPGSCWDYIHAVFNRAGFTMRRRKEAHRAPKKGPYLDPGLIQPGDWLYYRNLSFGRIEHSAIFVEWINQPSKVALMLSYPGQSRAVPARFRPYELTNVYTIIRPN